MNNPQLSLGFLNPDFEEAVDNDKGAIVTINHILFQKELDCPLCI